MSRREKEPRVLAGPITRPDDSGRRAARDACLATAALLVAVYLGSARLRDLDDALFGYLGATLVACFATVYRTSLFWRRRASRFYVRALLGALRDRDRWRRVVAAGGRDLVAQRFIARRSHLRWLAHLLLSLGTLAGFAITLPLVFGWMHFAADGESRYRVVFFSLPAGSFAIDGALGWLVFHALTLAAGAVVLGGSYFLGVRLRRRRVAGEGASFHLAPIVLLLSVAATGLALPATRDLPSAFAIASVAHQASVVALLVALSTSKLAHVLVRPLQLGARVVRADGERRLLCSGCGGALAPVAQQAAVEALLDERGFRFGAHQRQCPACRRRKLAGAQARLLDAHFQPTLAGARPAPAAAPARAA